MDNRPLLIVFDLDYTLWPFWADAHVDPPFQKKSDGKIYDRRGQHVKCYPDVPKMLTELKRDGYKVAFASSPTGENKPAEQLVELFGWNQCADYQEIYPGSKITHFQRFYEQSKIPYKKMLFFDDLYRNLSEVSSLGVTCIHAEDGMSMALLQKGLEAFSRRAQKS